VVGSVRLRLALAAIAVVAVTLGAGSVGLAAWFHQSATDDLVAVATGEASEVAGLAGQGALPGTIPVRAGVAVQVVDASGKVVAASADVLGRQSVSPVRPAVGSQEVIRTPAVFRQDDDPDLTVAVSVATPTGPDTVFAMTSVEQVEDQFHLLALGLLVLVTVVVVVSGGLAWILAGRALRPVEAVRAEVADINAGDLHRRVPEPMRQDEIGRLARTMNAMLGRLEESVARQQEFVSDASHELRSPLAALMAQIDVARAHPDAADWPAVAEVVTDEAERLSRIVDDLLLLARADEGHLVAGEERVDIDELVLAEAVRLRAQGHVLVDLRQVGAAPVAGDREQLRRMVRNLVDNAECHARTTVTFGLTCRGGTVELVVADDGPGIPEDQRERIFERFARVDGGRNRSTGGTGLGLAIVGKVVEAHGGTVTVEDSDVGTRMVVRLPVHPIGAGPAGPGPEG
jgi:signal transduction histidine kinase